MTALFATKVHPDTTTGAAPVAMKMAPPPTPPLPLLLFPTNTLFTMDTAAGDAEPPAVEAETTMAEEPQFLNSVLETVAPGDLMSGVRGMGESAVTD